MLHSIASRVSKFFKECECDKMLTKYKMAHMSTRLIDSVKKYPALYDSLHPDYKNTKEKDKIWEEIGKELGENGPILKTKWKNLRDCYAKYLRNNYSQKTTGQTSKNFASYKTWPWAKQMETFRPLLKFTRTASNISYEGMSSDISSSNEHVDHMEATYTTTRPKEEKNNVTFNEEGPKRKKARKDNVGSPHSDVDKVMSYLQQNRDNTSECATSNLDATEFLFLGFAKTIKTLSPRRQALAKLKIANIVMEQELQQREEEENSLLTSVNSAITPIPSTSGSVNTITELNNTVTQHPPSNDSTEDIKLKYNMK